MIRAQQYISKLILKCCSVWPPPIHSSPRRNRHEPVRPFFFFYVLVRPPVSRGSAASFLLSARGGPDQTPKPRAPPSRPPGKGGLTRTRPHVRPAPLCRLRLRDELLQRGPVRRPQVRCLLPRLPRPYAVVHGDGERSTDNRGRITNANVRRIFRLPSSVLRLSSSVKLLALHVTYFLNAFGHLAKTRICLTTRDRKEIPCFHGHIQLLARRQKPRYRARHGATENPAESGKGDVRHSGIGVPLFERKIRTSRRFHFQLDGPGVAEIIPSWKPTRH